MPSAAGNPTSPVVYAMLLAYTWPEKLVGKVTPPSRNTDFVRRFVFGGGYGQPPLTRTPCVKFDTVRCENVLPIGSAPVSGCPTCTRATPTLARSIVMFENVQLNAPATSRANVSDCRIVRFSKRSPYPP